MSVNAIPIGRTMVLGTFEDNRIYLPPFASRSIPPIPIIVEIQYGQSLLLASAAIKRPHTTQESSP